MPAKSSFHAGGISHLKRVDVIVLQAGVLDSFLDDFRQRPIHDEPPIGEVACPVGVSA